MVKLCCDIAGSHVIINKNFLNDVSCWDCQRTILHGVVERIHVQLFKVHLCHFQDSF